MVDKKSELLYEVDCGLRGKSEVKHVDRLRLQKLHILEGEVNDDMVKGVNHDIEHVIQRRIHTRQRVCMKTNERINLPFG